MEKEPKLISRAEAISLGLPRYYNGRVCRAGHRAERLVSNYTCLVCAMLRARSENKTPERRNRTREVENLRYRKNPVKKILRACRNRALAAGVPFDLIEDDIVIPATCPILGIKLETGSTGFNPSSPSVDRLVPEKGYVRGNIAVISFRANRVKYNSTYEEIEAVFNYMKMRRNVPTTNED